MNSVVGRGVYIYIYILYIYIYIYDRSKRIIKQSGCTVFSQVRNPTLFYEITPSVVKRLACR